MMDFTKILKDFVDEEQQVQSVVYGNGDATTKKEIKGSFLSIHSSGFRDFLLKAEILRAIVESGYEQPSPVMHQCFPHALTGSDILCQVKSGFGKTAVFVLATLEQLTPTENQVNVLVMCYNHELAFEISKEYEMISKYMPYVKVGLLLSGMPSQKDEEVLKNCCPHVVIGSPDRILYLVRNKKLDLKHVKHFIIDECDILMGFQDVKKNVQEIFDNTPHKKQVMMFSTRLRKELRPVCKKFMQEPMEVYVDDEAKLTLQGIQHYYVKLTKEGKEKRLCELLDVLDFNQAVIFVKSSHQCMALLQLLREKKFPAIAIHYALSPQERLSSYQKFSDFQKRILVMTNLSGIGIDIKRVNVVFHVDMPLDPRMYLRHVAKAGLFGTKGLAITFVSDENDAKILNEVQDRFNANITELPDQIELSSYIEW